MSEPLQEEFNTEERILESAKRVFVKKGMDGAVMQDIANLADISRTALHYYFRSKEKLFDAVLTDILNRSLPKLSDIMEREIPFQDKLDQFVHEYLGLLKANPYLPNFVMNELTRNPGKIIHQFAEKGLLSARTIFHIERELEAFDPHISVPQFVMNLVSLCVFPFIAKPLLTEAFAGGDPVEFDRLMSKRKRIIVETLLCSIGCSADDSKNPGPNNPNLRPPAEGPCDDQ
jgi:AcrR family transcriptional regulator